MKQLKIKIIYFKDIALHIFLILSFFSITISTNLYVVYAFLFTLFLLLISVKKTFIPLLLSLLFLLIIYFAIKDFRSIFRILKTFVIYLPFLLVLNKNFKINCFKILDFYVIISIFFILFELTLFLLFKTTILEYDIGFYVPRMTGFLGDPNFMALFLLIYLSFIDLRKIILVIFLVIAIVLTQSFTALVVLFLYIMIHSLLNFFKITIITYKTKLIFFILFIVFNIFYLFIVYKTADNIRNFQVGERYNVKLISIAQRFELQKEGLIKLFDQDQFLLGVGAGKTTDSTQIHKNFHNTFLQILFEMGFITIFFVLIIILFLFLLLKGNNSIILFFLFMTIVANLIEVYYVPYFGLIYYLDYKKNVV